MAKQSKKYAPKLENLSKENADEIPPVYMAVFEDHPWHEQFECGAYIGGERCGAGPYAFSCSRERNCSEFESGKLFLINDEPDQRCLSCGASLTDYLEPMYTHESVREDFLQNTENEGFVGIGGKVFNKLVSFSFGYNFPLNHPPKEGGTWYNEAGNILMDRGVDPSEAFYHNEAATLREFNGNGIGTDVLKEMLLRVRENDRKYVVFRTINPAMTRCYEKVFGLEEGGLKGSFEDPNPDKRQMWYYLDLSKLT